MNVDPGAGLCRADTSCACNVLPGFKDYEKLISRTGVRGLQVY